MDNMIITQTFTMARWQIVVKKSEATKQTKTIKPKPNQNKTKNKKLNDQNKQTNKKREEGREVIKQITNRMLS